MAPGCLRQLTFGLRGDQKYTLGRPVGRPAGVSFLIYSTVKKQKENVV